MRIIGTRSASRLQFGATLALITIAYFAAGKLGLSLAFLNPSASPVWPPTGIAIATLLLLGNRYWPAIFVGAFLVNLTTAGSVWTSIAIAAGNTLEGLVAATLTRRFAGGKRAFETVNGLLTFMVLAGGVATMISASVGVTTLILSDLVSPANFGSVWLTWWTGDAVSAWIITPLIVLWMTDTPRIGFDALRLAENLLLLGLLTFLGITAFMDVFFAHELHYPLAYLSFIPVVWAAVRFRPRDAMTVIFLLSCIAIIGTLAGMGPFAITETNTSLLMLQSFLGVVTLTGLPFAITMRERKLAEEEMRALNQSLERRVEERTAELQSMHEQERANNKRIDRAKSEFMSLASHQLRTPLTKIRWAMSRLAKTDALTRPQSALVTAAKDATEAMTETIDSMLTISQIEAGKVALKETNIALHPLFEELKQECHDECRARAQTLRIVCRHTLAFKTDRQLLREILRNLLQNAIKYTPNGGSVTLRAFAHVSPCIEIEDTGIGIPLPEQSRVFQKFFRGQNASDLDQTGTGLGLYLAHSAATLLRAHLTFTSTLGKGTTFTLRFPASAHASSLSIPRISARSSGVSV